MAEGNSAAGKASSPDHINVSSKKVFGGARKSATRNACAMCSYTFYNHFQQQLAPSPAGAPQPMRTQNLRAIGSKGWVWALQSPPRNKIATIKIKTMTSVKTVHHFISEDGFGEMVLPKRGFNFQMVSGRIKPIYSKQTGSDLFSRNGMIR